MDGLTEGYASQELLIQCGGGRAGETGPAVPMDYRIGGKLSSRLSKAQLQKVCRDRRMATDGTIPEMIARIWKNEQVL